MEIWRMTETVGKFTGNAVGHPVSVYVPKNGGSTNKCGEEERPPAVYQWG